MPTSLLQHIARYITLTAEETALLLPYLKVKELNKKAFLFREGQACTANYFVVNGCMRLYFVNEKGVDNIIQFGIDNWWITDYNSLDGQRPSAFYLQAVEPSTVIALEKRDEEKLFEQIPKMERYFHLVLRKAYGAAQWRFKYLYDLSGEERYHQFAQLFPDFVQRVPQYMLASYLGFTPEFLSKIRARKV